MSIGSAILLPQLKHKFVLKTFDNLTGELLELFKTHLVSVKINANYNFNSPENSNVQFIFEEPADYPHMFNDLFNRSLLSIIELDLLRHNANNTFLRFSDIDNVSCSYELDYSKSECAQFILNFNAKATKFNV